MKFKLLSLFLLSTCLTTTIFANTNFVKTKTLTANFFELMQGNANTTSRHTLGSFDSISSKMVYQPYIKLYSSNTLGQCTGELLYNINFGKVKFSKSQAMQNWYLTGNKLFAFLKNQHVDNISNIKCVILGVSGDSKNHHIKTITVR